MKIFKRVFSYISPKKRIILIIIGLIFIATIISSAAPLVQSSIIGILEEGVEIGNVSKQALKKIINFAIVLFTMYCLTTILRLIYGFLITKSVQNGVKNLRNEVQLKIHQVPIKYYDSKLLGEVSSRITSDIETLANGLQQGIGALVGSVFSLVLVITMMMVVNYIIGLIVIGIVLPIVITTAYFIIRKTSKTYRKQQEALGHFHGIVQEKYTGFKEITLYGKQKDAIKELDFASTNLANLGFKSQFNSGLMNTVASFLVYLMIASIALIGIKVLNFTVMSLQPLVLFSWFLLNPLSQITQLFGIVFISNAASKRIFEFLDEDNEKEDHPNPKTIEIVQGNIVFDNVWFGYHDTPILKGLTFQAKPGETIAIVGPTGAGKTTLINLLMRFYDVDQGDILLDNVSIYDLKRDDLRKTFGMVLQDTWLFKGTIRENIKYGMDGATEEQMITAAKLANVNHFIETLPGGYDMIINEEADNISQGEKQLLTIARAILANPSILILDEATSTVDTRIEHLLQQAMGLLMKNRTSFVIAHRLSTIKNADLILVIDEGIIVESGTHENLLLAKGFYYDLYQSQFS